MKQSQPLRIEENKYATFSTSRTVQSRLWFVNNLDLVYRVMAFFLKYVTQYNTKVYAFVIMGNHYHTLADFERGTRAKFFRDFNANFANTVQYFTNHGSGPVFERRYSPQAVPRNSRDILEKVFYCALQPVAAGLCERAIHYQGYNSFFDMVEGKRVSRVYVAWRKFLARLRNNGKLKKDEFSTEYHLLYARPPGFEDWPQDKFKKFMLGELKRREDEIIARRKSRNQGFVGLYELKKTVPGSLPKNTKKSVEKSKRPLVLSLCPREKKKYLEFYFSVLQDYKIASREYLAGNYTVEFPPYTYRPPLCMVMQT